MNSMERVMTAIGHKEPDRVPLFHLLSFYGAKELGISIKEYFSKPEYVIKAQLKMIEKYSNDCIYTFFYAPIEVEAFGGEVIFTEDGPPNTGEPVLKHFDQIEKLKIPDIRSNTALVKVLEVTNSLYKINKGDRPIIGVVMSPFSLPVMQIGFEKYIELIYFRKDEFNTLMKINEEFCVSWANAQLEAGATAICYFDPLASPAIIDRETYLQTGNKIAKKTIKRIKGATATHLASGIALPILDDIVATGSAVLGFSAQDNIEEIKEASHNKICLLGNLNGVDMANWDTLKIRDVIKNVISKAAKGGGLILSDNHGEVPWQVTEEVLLEISETVKALGTYPINLR